MYFTKASTGDGITEQLKCSVANSIPLNTVNQHLDAMLQAKLQCTLCDFEDHMNNFDATKGSSECNLNIMNPFVEEFLTNNVK